MGILKLIHLTLAFALELGMLASMAYWGFQQGNNTIVKYIYAIALPLIAMVLWGIFAAPKSDTRIAFPTRLVFEMSLFAIAAFMLYKTGKINLALIFLILAVMSESFAFFTER